MSSRKDGISRREFLKMLGVAGTVAMVPGLAGCAADDGGSPTGDVGGGKFVAALKANPQGLDPQFNSNTESFQAMLNIYETLIDYDPRTDEFFPQLITKMPDMSDPTHFVFELREDVKFHDGTPLTAEDVKYTFDWILEMGSQSPSYSLYSTLEEVNILDTYKVEMKLSFPYGMFIPYLASIMGGIVKKDCRDNQDLVKNPAGVGCGPYRFKEWVEGDHLSYEKYADYHQPGVPHFDTFEYRILVEETARTAQLMTGDVDFVGIFPQKDFKALTSRDDIDGKVGPSTQVGYVLLNHLNDLGSNKHLRRALSFAIDGQAMLDTVLEGYGLVANGPVRSNAWWYDPAVEEVMCYDLDRAKEELKLAGFEDGLEIDLYTQNSSYFINASILIKDMWSKIGVTANVLSMEKSAMYGIVKKGATNWTACYTTWSSSVISPDYMMKLVYTTNGSYMRCSWNNAEFDSYVEQAQRAGTKAQQKEALSKAQLLMAEEVASIWCMWHAWTPAWRSDIKGYEPAPSYYYYFDNVRRQK